MAAKPQHDEALIAALAAGGSAAAAARHAGCSERQARRRLADPDFRRRVDEAKSELVRATAGRLAALGTHFSEALRRNAECGVPAVEVRAASAGLAQMFRGAEVDVLARQLEELRREVEALRHERGEPVPGGLPAAVPGGAPEAGRAPGACGDAG
jgi:hypothetical protein